MKMMKQIVKYKTLLVLLTFIFFSLNLSAQQTVTVKSFAQTIDHIPVADRRNDLNGTPCALVKVQVVDDIERIEGNKIGDIINYGVEKWIYMCKGSRNMRIHFKNHLPVKITFRDYDINGLESNRVYELVLITQDQPKAITADVKGNYLQMRVTPNNAIIAIWGENYQRQSHRPQSDGTLRIYLPYGRYHYSAKAEGFNDLEGSVFVNDENKWETVALNVLMGTITISCLTEQADFFVDGEMVPKSIISQQWTGQVPLGTHHVEIHKTGYATQTKIVTVTSNETAYVSFGPLISLAEERKKMEEANRLRRDSLARALDDSLAIVAEKQRAKQDSIMRIQRAFNDSVKKVKHEAMVRKLAEKYEKTVVIGLAGGYNIASAKFSDNGGSVSSTGGIHLGLTAEMQLTDNLYFGTGLLFSQKGYNYKNEGHDIEEKGSAQFVDIPLQLELQLPVGGTTRFQLNAGPYAALCVGGKVQDAWYEGHSYSKAPGYDEKFSSVYTGFDYGLQAGLGIIINYHLRLAANYQQGMASKYQNQNIMLGIGYRF